LIASSFVRKSKLIIGLDLTANMSNTDPATRRAERDRLEKDVMQIISQTAEHAVAFKINRQLILPLGLFDGIPRVIDRIHNEGMTVIADCKLNDIGNTNQHIARYYFDAGFDALIVNPFVGLEGGLDSVLELSRNRKRGIITLCYMSHPGAKDGYGLYATSDPKKKPEPLYLQFEKKPEPLYLQFARKARMWAVDGIIVGATYPEKITEIRQVLGDEVPIICPGVGAQGGSARAALNAGADFVIAARSVVNADDPASAAATLATDTR
jgi:orotidine-5'-phosphate decarboxylase